MIKRFGVGAWILEPMRLRQLMSADVPIPWPEVQPDGGGADDAPYQVINGVAVIPLVGVLLKRLDPVCDLVCDCVSTGDTKEIFEAALSDPAVNAICVYVDSPGGQVAGSYELADAIAGATKPVYAAVSDLAASGGYLIASQCDKVFATRASLVGCIGTYMVVEDTSKLYAAAGVKVTVVKAGDFKAVGEDGVPITDGQIADLQRQINSQNDLFVRAVMSGRRMSRSQAEKVATGQLWVAAEAQGLGLIDGIASVEQVIGMLSGGSVSEQVNVGSGSQVNVKAEATVTAPTAADVSQIAADVEAMKAIDAATATKGEQTAEQVVAVENTVKVDAVGTVSADQLAGTINTVGTLAIAGQQIVSALKAIDADAAVKAARTDAYAEAVQHERQRLTMLLELGKGRVAWAVEQFVKGHDKGAATADLVAVLEKEIQGGSRVSGGASPVAVRPAGVSGGATVADFEAAWEGLDAGQRAKFSGKETFVAFKKYEANKAR